MNKDWNMMSELLKQPGVNGTFHIYCSGRLPEDLCAICWLLGYWRGGR